MRKLRSFKSKIRNADLDVFDLLNHYVDILDIMAEDDIVKGDKVALLELADKYLDANDRFMTVILGAEEEQVIESATKPNPTGFEFPMATSDPPNSELG